MNIILIEPNNLQISKVNKDDCFVWISFNQDKVNDCYIIKDIENTFNINLNYYNCYQLLQQFMLISKDVDLVKLDIIKHILNSVIYTIDNPSKD